MESMEERVSGFGIRGPWTDVVELGERITDALRDAGVSGEALEEWDARRPKAHERFDEEVEAKTSDGASIDEGAGERSDVAAGEDLQTAGEKLQGASEQLPEDSERALDSLQESVGHANRAADTAGRRALRAVEDAVYRNVMTQLSPSFFDNDPMSASVQRAGGFEDDGFVFEANVNDDDLRAEVSDVLADYEAEVDRWHIDTPKDASSVEAAENAEIPG